MIVRGLLIAFLLDRPVEVVLQDLLGCRLDAHGDRAHAGVLRRRMFFLRVVVGYV